MPSFYGKEKFSAADKIRYGGVSGKPEETDLHAFVRNNCLNAMDAATFRAAINAAEAGGSSNHNDLSLIDGGQGGEYFHLTSAQHTGVTAMYSAGLADLTSGEVTQLAKIGTTVISAGQFVYLGAMDQGVAMADNVTFANVSASNSPTAPADLTRKDYVDNLLDGLKWKESVVAATTTDGTLATAFANTQVIDGVTLATDDRILIKDQSTGSENGIYVVQAAGAPVRADDANTGSELISATVHVEQGTANKDTDFVCTNDTIVIDTTALVFVSKSGSSSHNSLSGLQGGTTNEYYHLTASQHTAVGSMVTAGLDGLSTGEVDQIKNIDGTTISAPQWGYLGGLDQDLAQAANVTFAGLTVNGAITVTGTVDGVDVAALQTDVDGFDDELKNLATGEINQLKNIDATTISIAQWGYVGGLDQSLSQSDNVTFGQITGTLQTASQSNVTSLGTQTSITTDAGTGHVNVGGRIKFSTNTQNVTAELTLTDSSEQYQYLDPTSGNQNVKMKVSPNNGDTFIIVHDGSANELQLKDNAGTNIGDFPLTAGNYATCQYENAEWKVFQ